MPAMAQNFPDAAELSEDNVEDLKICECSMCGLVQLDTEPVKYYREVIRAVAFSEEMKRFRLGQFAEFVDTYQLSGKRMLEIGAGAGEYLDLMQAQGVETRGIEAGAAGETHPRIDKYYLERGSSPLPDSPYDAFFCLNFLEHMPDPKGSLIAIHTSLKPNGIGLIEVPNFDMILEKKIFSEFIRDHLFYFTTRTLTTLLEQSGFEVLSCKPVWHDYSLSATIKKRSLINLAPLVDQKLKIKNSITSFIKGYSKKELAIWGAGHQALATVSMLKMNVNFGYVIDSAKYKQNKYTPGSHILISPPSIIEKKKIKAILIIAGSYSDEVVESLKQNKNRNLKIGILRSDWIEEVS